MATLTLIRTPAGGTPLQVFQLDMTGKDQLIIGRQKTTTETHSAADIVLDDGLQSISRHQAVVTLKNGTYYATYLGHGPLILENVRLHSGIPHALKHEDKILICNFLLQFHNPEAEVQLRENPE